MFKVYGNIKARRLELGMSQSALAEKMGYADKGMISRIENGQVDLSISKVIEFAKVLNIPPLKLMGWDEDEIDTAKAKCDELINVYNELNQDVQEQLLKIAKTYLPE